MFQSNTYDSSVVQAFVADDTYVVHRKGTQGLALVVSRIPSAAIEINSSEAVGKLINILHEAKAMIDGKEESYG